MDVYDKDKEKVNPAPYVRRDEDYDSNRGAIDADAERLQRLFERPDIPALNIKAAEDAAGAPADAAGSEEADKLGKGYTGDSKKKGRFNLGNRMRRRVAAGLLAGGVLGGAGFLGFTGLQPLRIMHITTNAQNTFFSAFDRADENMNDALFRHYIVKSVVPGMVKNGCTTTAVSKSCASVGSSGNMVSALYQTWHDANLEGKLANDHGIEIRRVGNNFYLRMDSINGDLDLGEWYLHNTRDFEGKAFAQMNRSGIRNNIRTALQNETKAKQIRYFFAVNDLLARKYGIRHCIVACDTRDTFSESFALKKMAVNGFIFERYITPNTEMLGLAFECAISGFNCTDPGSADANGERLSTYQTSVRDRLLEHRARHGETSLEDLDKEANEIREKGMTHYVLKSLAGETAAKVAVKTIPVVGWIDMFANIISAGSKVGPALRHINYVKNSTGMVAMFTMYRTVVDEQKFGRMDATMLGSVSDSFNAVVGGDQGGAAAESSPAYWAMMGDGTRQIASIRGLTGTGTASAAVARATCDEEGNYPTSATVCPKVSFGEGSTSMKITDTISEIFNDPALFLPTTLANAWTGFFGSILTWITSVLPTITLPGVEEIVAWVKDTLFSKLLVEPLTDNASGVRRFEIMLGGADVAGNDSAHYKQGGRVLSSAEVAAIRQAAADDRKAEFQKLPLYARLFDKNESQSLISQIALALPSSSSSATSGLASLSTFPMRLASFFGSFGDSSASAAFPGADPFGITQYGYPENDPIFSQDPEKLWDQQDCANPTNVQTWGDKATRINPYTGVPEHDVSNPCMLLRSSISSSGGLFNKELLLPPTVPGAAGAATNGGLGTVGSFTFPLKTTQTAIKQSSPAWCYASQTSCHHDYPAADIFANPGTEIVAAVSGTVVTYKPEKICNNQVGGYPSMQIKGDDGNYYYYAHFAQGSLLQTTVGSKITAGQRLGTVGPEECAQGTSPHLHIQAYTSIINGNAESMEIQPSLVKAFGALPQ